MARASVSGVAWGQGPAVTCNTFRKRHGLKVTSESTWVHHSQLACGFLYKYQRKEKASNLVGSLAVTKYIFKGFFTQVLWQYHGIRWKYFAVVNLYRVLNGKCSYPYVEIRRAITVN